MKVSPAERTFWNAQDITTYFEAKPADPRIETFLEAYTESVGAVTALDLGCGGGRHSELLASLGHDTHSIDVNPAMLDTTARRIAANGLSADIREGSIDAIPFSDASFDIVVTTGVLHQANNIAEYLTAIAELSRVMKPGAYVLLNIFTNAVWDESYTTVSEDGFSVITREGLPQTLLPRELFDALMAEHSLVLVEDQGEEIKQENTGPRAVYRAIFQKQ